MLGYGYGFRIAVPAQHRTRFHGFTGAEPVGRLWPNWVILARNCLPGPILGLFF
jgi:hypothetical protein